MTAYLIEKDKFWTAFVETLERRIKDKLPDKAFEAEMMDVVMGELRHIYQHLPYGY